MKKLKNFSNSIVMKFAPAGAYYTVRHCNAACCNQTENSASFCLLLTYICLKFSNTGLDTDALLHYTCRIGIMTWS